MKAILEHERAVLLHGDAADLAEVLPENSVDAIVTDPPAGIGFMSKEWDKDKGGRDSWVRWLAATLAASFRALKPGGHALVWALPRTSHWTAWALELCGFEIRDRVAHFFGSGFPKSLTSNSADIPDDSGTALKPAVEDWWLVRKPLDGTVGENFARWGTGILNIGACRIGSEGTLRPSGPHEEGWGMQRQPVTGSEAGRWPAHLTLDEEAAALLDEQAGELTSGSRHAGVRQGRRRGLTFGDQAGDGGPAITGSSGGASRFFYCAKPAKSETEAGLDHLPVKSGGELTGREDETDGLKSPRAGAGRGGGRRNHHPTKKAITLMRWLCRLITPPGGTILDPFAGSGSTGVAALREGFSFVGAELTDEYLPILEGRIRYALSQTADDPAA